MCFSWLKKSTKWFKFKKWFYFRLEILLKLFNYYWIISRDTYRDYGLSNIPLGIGTALAWLEIAAQGASRKWPQSEQTCLEGLQSELLTHHCQVQWNCEKCSRYLLHFLTGAISNRIQGQSSRWNEPVIKKWFTL